MFQSVNNYFFSLSEPDRHLTFNVGEKIDLPFIINFCSKIYFTFKYIYTATYFCNEELSVNTL